MITIAKTTRIFDATIAGDIVASGALRVPIGKTLAFEGDIDFSNATISGFPPLPPLDLDDATLTGITTIAVSPTNPLIGSLDVQVPMTVSATTQSTFNGRIHANDMLTAAKAVVITPSATNPTTTLTSLPAPTGAEIGGTVWMDSADGNRLRVGSADKYATLADLSDDSATFVFSNAGGEFAAGNSVLVSVRKFRGQVTLTAEGVLTLSNGIPILNVPLIVIGTIPVGFRPLHDVTQLVMMNLVPSGGAQALCLYLVAATGQVQVFKSNLSPWISGDNLSFVGPTIAYNTAV
ncbi:MAG: hypothetical protein WC763_05920 [Candidatus Paceibacterota bacterium]|jgi:hypothetical protein